MPCSACDAATGLTTKGYDHKTPIRTSFDRRFNRYSQLPVAQRILSLQRCRSLEATCDQRPLEQRSWVLRSHLRVQRRLTHSGNRTVQHRQGVCASRVQTSRADAQDREPARARTSLLNGAKLYSRPQPSGSPSE